MELKEEGLKREIGVRALAANSFNMTVGAGIFALPALVYLQAGTAGIFAYLICGFAIIVIMLCFAEIGSRISASGGSYAYVDATLGRFAGFLTNLLYLVGFAMASNAAIANALLNTFSSKLEWLNIPLLRVIILFVLYSGMVWLNIMGTKKAVRFVEITTLAKLIPLVGLVLVGLFL